MPRKSLILQRKDKMKKAIAVVVLAGTVLSESMADLFTFDLINKNGASWDGLSTGVYTNAGSGLPLSATLSAYLNGSSSSGSQLNSTSGSFGLNAPTSADDSSFFDTAAGQEAVWISFNRAVTVKSITVSSFTLGNVETGSYQVANGALVYFTASGTYTVDAALSQGSYFKVSAADQGGGNGWSLNSVVVEAIPEPATIVMLGLGGLTTGLIRRSIAKKAA